MDPLRYRNISFELLKEPDLPLLYRWLQEPHVREFYHRKGVSSWEETRDHYRERFVIDWPTKCFLSCVGRPIGYIQTYRVTDYPDYAAMIGAVEGISVDLFIGDVDHLGIGWGRLVLLKFLNEVAFPLFPGENVCWIYHEKLNQRALRASKAVGFRHVRDFREDGNQKELLSLSKEESATRFDLMASI